MTFAPAKGEPVARIELSGGECSVTSVELTGTMACNYPGVESEAIDHELEFTTGSGSKLEALGGSVTLTGLDVFWLALPKTEWSVK